MDKLAADKRFGERIQGAYRNQIMDPSGKLRAPLRVLELPQYLMSKTLGLPVRMAGSAAASAVAGPKAWFGPMAGRRLQSVPGGPGVGMDMIDPGEWNDIRSGKTQGRAYSGVVDGKKYLFKQRYRPGGLLGLARKHPIMAGGAALLGLYMLSQPRNPQMDGGGQGGIQLSPEVLASLQAQPVNNPLGSNAWG